MLILYSPLFDDLILYYYNEQRQVMIEWALEAEEEISSYVSMSQVRQEYGSSLAKYCIHDDGEK